MNYKNISKYGINSAKWKHIREAVLRRDNYLDAVAARYGKRREATHVHHIFPREFFPEWTFEPWNLISVSTETHNALHDRESHKLTAKGIDLLLRTARKNSIEVNEEMLDTIRASTKKK